MKKVYDNFIPSASKIKNKFIRSFIIFSFFMIINLTVNAADKVYSHISQADFNNGTNSNTRITADGKVMLAINNNATVQNTAINWGTALSPKAEESEYIWIEAEDVIPLDDQFWRISSGLSIGKGEWRWSNKPAVYTNKQEATSAAFDVNLPLTAADYDLYIRTEHWNAHGLPSTLQLYVDGVLWGTVSPSGGSLAWKKISATIPGGSHSLYLKAIASASETNPALVIDQFLFTTDTNYTPPNPVDTNGKLDKRFTYAWLEAEDIIPFDDQFWRISSGLSIGKGEGRWSNKPAVYTNKQQATSATFNVNLPFTGFSYDLYIRAEHWNSHGYSSTIELYVDNQLCGSISPNGANLAWHKISAAITGGTHELYVKAITDPNETGPAVVIDEFLFTTDTSYTPPNPVDTNGKILGSSLESTGTYTSEVIDTGLDTLSWRYIKWTEELPSGTSIEIRTKTGATAIPDGSWSDWSDTYILKTGEAVQSPVNRYIQYQAVLTADPTKTLSPILKDVTIVASTETLPVSCNYGIYSIFYGDSGSIPGYVYWAQGNQLGYYDFSIIMSIGGGYTQYGQNGTLISDIKASNSNHKVIIRLNAPWYLGVSLLDYYYNSKDRTTVRNDWTASITAAGATNVYGVTIGEENLVAAWSGWFSSTAPQWALDYASAYEAETGNSFDWAGRNTNGYLTWLQGKTKWVFNDLYSWFKTNYNTKKVYQFMYIPEDNTGWGKVNLEPNEYNADGWVVQYSGDYEGTYNAVKKIRDTGISNDDIYVQIWGHKPSNNSLIWQTIQVESMGLQNIFVYYFRAWVPPAYTTPCDYYGLDIYDGVQDGIFCGEDGRWSYDQRILWENYIN